MPAARVTTAARAAAGARAALRPALEPLKADCGCEGKERGSGRASVSRARLDRGVSVARPYRGGGFYPHIQLAGEKPCNRDV